MKTPQQKLEYIITNKRCGAIVCTSCPLHTGRDCMTMPRILKRAHMIYEMKYGTDALSRLLKERV